MKFATLQKSKRGQPLPATKQRQPLRSVMPPSLAHPVVQARLRIGAPNDRWEQEADRMADMVMRAERMSRPAPSDPPPTLQRECADCSSGHGLCAKCAEEERLQAKPSTAIRGTSPGTERLYGQPDRLTSGTPSSVHRVLSNSGAPLDVVLRQDMERRFGYDFSRVRVHSGTAAAQSADDVNARAYTVGQNIVFGGGRFAPDTRDGRQLLAHELTHVIQQSNGGQKLQRKIDFEFDLNWGIEGASPPTGSESAVNAIADETVLTGHERRGPPPARDLKDGFQVVMDGNRMEINTARFGIRGGGRRELTDTMTNILSFVNELKTGCEAVSPVTVPTPADRQRPGVPLGKPRFFDAPFSVPPGQPMFPLGTDKYFRSTCSVSAAPQCTMDVPLSGVNPLVQAIKSSKGQRPGRALTGPDARRAGVRSDALFHAQSKVNASRRRHVRLGTTLSNGTTVTNTNFSESLTGFMILLVSYLRSSVVIDPRDFEEFAKAYPPIVVHTHFRDLFHRALNVDERMVFTELFGDPAARTNLYAMATSSPASAGSKDLFPPKVQAKQIAEFGHKITWDEFVNSTIADTPILSTAGVETLPTPLATATVGPQEAGPEGARVPGAKLEMRRIGFNWVPSSAWRGLTDRLFTLARTLNGETGPL